MSSLSLNRSYLYLLTLLILSLLVCGVSGDSQTVVSYHPSEVRITADSSVPGYVANGIANADKVFAGYGDVVLISGTDIPYGKILHAEVTIGSSVSHLQGYEISLSGFPKNRAMLIMVHLSLATDPHPPVIDNGGEGGGNDDDDEDDQEGGNNDPGTNPEPENPKPSNPVNPGRPVVPDTPDVPVVPSTPSEPENPYTPDTPGSDEPGSDEPYTPILPPAGSVYNFAGFIPLVAGFLLLFLLFFMRGNLVYRILVKNAKKHGEKPDKEEKKHLKEIAGVIVGLVKVEDKYPEWRKNSDVMKRLWFDIESVLDEMNYVRAVPRGALVAEIIKAARGRINRHRL